MMASPPHILPIVTPIEAKTPFMDIIVPRDLGTCSTIKLCDHVTAKPPIKVATNDMNSAL
jgi:hypothetical protein